MFFWARNKLDFDIASGQVLNNCQEPTVWPSDAHLVTHSQFTWACWANCTDECWDLTQAFSEGSEHLSVWYAAYTEPVSRAFKPALTQKTSDDPLRDKRDFISSFAIVNMVLQQCTGRNLAFKFKKAYICLKKIHLGCFLRWNLKENITFLSCFPSFIFVQYGELNITHKLFQCKHSLHRNSSLCMTDRLSTATMVERG